MRQRQTCICLRFPWTSESISNARQLAISTCHPLRFWKILRDQNLGGSYRLAYLAEKLRLLGLDLSPEVPEARIENAFFHRLVRFTIHHTLRDIKHGARIPVDKGWLLPGVADEGPAFEKEGHENVFHLPDGQIFRASLAIFISLTYLTCFILLQCAYKVPTTKSLSILKAMSQFGAALL